MRSHMQIMVFIALGHPLKVQTSITHNLNSIAESNNVRVRALSEIRALPIHSLKWNTSTIFFFRIFLAQ